MTTLEPGASVVLTQGLRFSPRSTALRATSAAEIITCGLDVLVHDVIAVITTAPWSSSNSPTRTGVDGRPFALAAADTSWCGLSAGSSEVPVGGSLAGNDSRLDSSAGPFSDCT